MLQGTTFHARSLSQTSQTSPRPISWFQTPAKKDASLFPNHTGHARTKLFANQIVTFKITIPDAFITFSPRICTLILATRSAYVFAIHGSTLQACPCCCKLIIHSLCNNVWAWFTCSTATLEFPPQLHHLIFFGNRALFKPELFFKDPFVPTLAKTCHCLKAVPLQEICHARNISFGRRFFPSTVAPINQ